MSVIALYNFVERNGSITIKCEFSLVGTVIKMYFKRLPFTEMFKHPSDYRMAYNELKVNVYIYIYIYIYIFKFIYTAKLYNNLRVIGRVALKTFVSDDNTKIVENCRRSP
jgi:hypothetical protein